MTESPFINRWVSLGEAQGRLAEARLLLNVAVKNRFGDAVSGALHETINDQTNLSLLGDWFKVVLAVNTAQDFIAHIRPQVRQGRHHYSA